MTSTRDFKETVAARVRRDPEFVRALVDEAISLFKNGEAETAKQILTDLLNASVEPKSLTAELGDPRHEAMVAIYETMQALHQIGSFFQLLKRERIRRQIYATRAEGRADVFNYIEMFYNPKRRHSTATGLSPVQFEERHSPRSAGV